MKSFDVPIHYRSPLITAIKTQRRNEDKMKKDYAPSSLHLGSLEIFLARHFGFCYGVEHAIEIAFKALAENKDKRIYLLSEMIHNPEVNADLQNEGVQFIMDTKGNQLINWNQLSAEDIVIVPAFGTTIEIEHQLKNMGIEPMRYNTTCPFVEKVWNRSEKIGQDGYTIVVHGKPQHEETRATFSHSEVNAPTIVVKDIYQTQQLAKYIRGLIPLEQFQDDFKGQYSTNFNPEKDLIKIGVVNQTTMLASETQEISDFLKQTMMDHYGVSGNELKLHFADTRDTLCYATNDNQTAVKEMLETKADLALVIGGYNSSNTSHLVELCEQKMPTYFIRNEACLLSENEIKHFDLKTNEEIITQKYLPNANHNPIKVLITSGASCPDSLVEKVIYKLAQIFNSTQALDILAQKYESA